MKRIYLFLALLSTFLLVACGTQLQGNFSETGAGKTGASAAKAGDLEYLGATVNSGNSVVAKWKAPTNNAQGEYYEVSLVVDSGETMSLDQFKVAPGEIITLTSDAIAPATLKTLSLKACSQRMSEVEKTTLVCKEAGVGVVTRESDK